MAKWKELPSFEMFKVTQPKLLHLLDAEWWRQVETETRSKIVRAKNHNRLRAIILTRLQSYLLKTGTCENRPALK
jgi:hypothetical protein